MATNLMGWAVLIALAYVPFVVCRPTRKPWERYVDYAFATGFLCVVVAFVVSNVSR